MDDPLAKLADICIFGVTTVLAFRALGVQYVGLCILDTPWRTDMLLLIYW